METFIEISPAKDKDVCQNCEHFDKWGVYIGRCSVMDENVGDDFTCKDFTRNENKES